MASSPRSQLAFHVKRREPEIVVLAKPIARELKKLSYIDDQEGMRSLFGLFWFYNNNDSLSKQGKEPVKVIREALGRALVYYYPLAGRLVKDPARVLWWIAMVKEHC
ncbi:hypothetical protein FNV43_RR08865 [Rhamnella rubrinervis]|uniref:Uncharacterized protein n=1 Tax=Rhamnella rubrinervis TaxID=2594499 RepID=A0A8K0HA19_9ROSA|nr:hypothetical protein FNV43_RR08865 [Rhamnella rubrinervis]